MLLVSAVVLAIGTGIFLRSISDVNESADSEMSLKAWSLAGACGEYALNQLSTTTDGRAGWSYSGESLPVGDETCYINVVASGTAKVIQASSTVGNFTRKVKIEVATNTPSIVISSWAVVADF